MRGLLVLFAMTTLSLQAFGDTYASSFKWKGDRFFVTLTEDGGQSFTVKGDMREVVGESAVATDSGYNVSIQSYSGYVSVIVAPVQEEFAQLSIFRIENRDFVLATDPTIKGRAVDMGAQLKAALDGLTRILEWDVTLSFRAMIAYFRTNPNQMLSDFTDQVELGRVVSVPVPGADYMSADRTNQPGTIIEDQDATQEQTQEQTQDEPQDQVEPSEEQPRRKKRRLAQAQDDSQLQEEAYQNDDRYQDQSSNYDSEEDGVQDDREPTRRRYLRR